MQLIMEKDQNEIPFSVHCDLIERELARMLDDIREVRANESRKKLVMSKCLLLQTALGSVRHYLRELMISLKNEKI